LNTAPQSWHPDADAAPPLERGKSFLLIQGRRPTDAALVLTLAAKAKYRRAGLENQEFLSERRIEMATPAKNMICLWYNGDAEEAARFYADTFPDSFVGTVYRAPGDFPSGKRETY